MTDQRTQWNERLTGANHATLPDTLNRGLMVEHNTDGTHKTRGAASGLASLNSSTLVVENPANATATSTAGKIPIADVNGDLDPGWINIPAGETTLGVDYSVSADGVWQDIGLSVTLPAAGTYLIMGNIFAVAQVSASLPFVLCKLHNATDAADVPMSVRELLQITSINEMHVGNVSYAKKITVNGAKTIKVYGYRSTGTYTITPNFQGQTDGRTNLAYIRVQ